MTNPDNNRGWCSKEKLRTIVLGAVLSVYHARPVSVTCRSIVWFEQHRCFQWFESLSMDNANAFLPYFAAPVFASGRCHLFIIDPSGDFRCTAEAHTLQYLVAGAGFVLVMVLGSPSYRKSRTKRFAAASSSTADSRICRIRIKSSSCSVGYAYFELWVRGITSSGISICLTIYDDTKISLVVVIRLSWPSLHSPIISDLMRAGIVGNHVYFMIRDGAHHISPKSPYLII